MLSSVLPFVAVPALSIPLWIAIAVGEGEVLRPRVERFAATHRLTITIHNGAQVISYLAATRRWRSFGLAAGLVASLTLDLPNLTINSLVLFAGWLAGALIAETRLAETRPVAGSHEAVPAMRRSLAGYLPRLPLLAVPISGATCLATGAITRDLAWAGLGVAGAAAVWLTQWRIVRRPQPFTEPDRAAADDAIRSRSAHVLAGGGFVFVTYCVLAQLDGVQWLVLLGFGLVPVAGFVMANRPWSVTRATP